LISARKYQYKQLTSAQPTLSETMSTNNMTIKRFSITLTERILTITLNRPEQMNAFTVEMANELEHAFYRASEDDECRRHCGDRCRQSLLCWAWI
jgi:1,4-dihydroxy-2-naphthoyl-CoA synthase